MMPNFDREVKKAQAQLAIATVAKGRPSSKSLEDLMNDDSITVTELMIEGLLPKCGLVLLGGRPKDGKSWFACQLALAVVTGQALGGWLRVREPGRVTLGP